MIAVPQPKAPYKAGPVGPGAGVLNTEFPLSTILGGGSGGTPQQRMKNALTVAKQSGWIDDAEAVIGGTIAGQPWHLVDAQNIEITSTYPEDAGKQALALTTQPQLNVQMGARYTRTQLWALTFRHMGICGNSFWYLDQRDAYAGAPAAILYIAPWRMWPEEDPNGNLIRWRLDRTADQPGLPIELDEIVHYMFRPPDEGHFGRGLVEIALLKAQNSIGFDKHVKQVLDAGGRLSGLLSPKQGDQINNEQYNQLVVDARTVVEQPDAAKRLQILRGPVDFTQTTMTIKDLQVAELMKLMRDDLLALWGVPLSQIGGAAPSGLNSGEVRKYDKQALWENANHPRLVSFLEAYEFKVLSRFAKLGTLCKLEVEEPQFADEATRFDLLGKSIQISLRNRERRQLIGLGPLGDEVINPQTGKPYDDEIWVPNNIVAVASAPSEEQTGNVGVAPVGDESTNWEQENLQPKQSDVAALAGETLVGPAGGAVPSASTSKTASQVTGGAPSPQQRAGTVQAKPGQKADISVQPGFPRVRSYLRDSLESRYRERIAKDVRDVFESQQREVTSRIKGNIAHLLANPKDSRVYYDVPKWERRLNEALAPMLTRMAEEVDVHARNSISTGNKAGGIGPVSAVRRALDSSAAKIVLVNQRTRDAVNALVEKVIGEATDKGWTVDETSQAFDAALAGNVVLANGIGAWSDARAETIARTELMAAYNAASLGTYADLGVEYVQASDGTQFDATCADRDGTVYRIEDADGVDEHPNGTLDWLPIPSAEALSVLEGD